MARSEGFEPSAFWSVVGKRVVVGVSLRSVLNDFQFCDVGRVSSIPSCLPVLASSVASSYVFLHCCRNSEISSNSFIASSLFRLAASNCPEKSRMQSRQALTQLF